jgi:hypothetical protein
MVLWGIERYLDEHLWLGEDGHLGSLLVQWAGGILAVAGIILLIARFGDLQRWRRGEGGDPAPVPQDTADSDINDAGSDSDSDRSASDQADSDRSDLPASVPSASAGPEPD